MQICSQRVFQKSILKSACKKLNGLISKSKADLIAGPTADRYKIGIKVTHISTSNISPIYWNVRIQSSPPYKIQWKNQPKEHISSRLIIFSTIQFSFFCMTKHVKEVPCVSIAIGWNGIQSIIHLTIITNWTRASRSYTSLGGFEASGFRSIFKIFL